VQRTVAICSPSPLLDSVLSQHTKHNIVLDAVYLVTIELVKAVALQPEQLLPTPHP